ncbi:hemin uptake protein HemP, partial [Shigella flexneri]
HRALSEHKTLSVSWSHYPDGKLIIDHDGQEYLLRKTQAGKLLLTK